MMLKDKQVDVFTFSLPCLLIYDRSKVFFFFFKRPKVSVLSAQNLRDADWGGKSDPYCVPGM